MDTLPRPRQSKAFAESDSLLTFQQRNGRVDRYGQNEQPEIYYLLTVSANEKIRGDQRILELLIARDEEVQRNIGDMVSALSMAFSKTPSISTR